MIVRMINQYRKISKDGPSWLEMLTATIPGLWLLWMNQYHIKWYNGAFNILSSIVIVAAFIGIARYMRHRLTPWFWPLLGMLLWSGWRFINWMLADRAMGWLTNYILSPLNSTTIILTGTIFVLIAVGIGGTYWTYKQLKGISNQWIWLYIGVLTMVILVTSIYTGLGRVQENCSGLYLIMFFTPCILRANLGFGIYSWLTLLFLLVPTILALRQTKEYGLVASLVVIAFIPIWSEMLFYPFQIFGVPLLSAYREVGECLTCSIIKQNILNTSYIISLGFMVILPIGFIIIRSEKFRMWWVLFLSFVTFATTYYVVIQTLILAQPIIDSSYLDWIMICLLLIELWFPIIYVATVKHHPYSNASQ